MLDLFLTVSKDYFERRELSFTLPGDIYIRYQSFRDEKALRGALISKVPIKIDIGAVFSANPRDMKKGLNIATAQERELVFDIDMTDYDDVRTCCKGADLCKKCWPFLAIAAKILDRALREDFGFKHLLWVYSGRRGIHCWVADERARKLSVDGRNAVGSYLTLIAGGQFQNKKVSFDNKKTNHHPSTRKALQIIDQHFVQLIIENQNHLGSRRYAEKMFSLCSSQNPLLKNSLINEVTNSSFSKLPPTKQWAKVEGIIEAHKKSIQSNLDRHVIDEIKVQYCYPRLDIAVTKGLNHLLKAPFCVHPKTSRVCIPFDVKNVDSFDVRAVPTLDSLKKEVDEYDAKSNVGGDQVKYYARTQLKQSIEIFEDFIAKLKVDNANARLILSDAKMEF